MPPPTASDEGFPVLQLKKAETKTDLFLKHVLHRYSPFISNMLLFQSLLKGIYLHTEVMKYFAYL